MPKKRSENWETDEKTLLRNIIRQHIHIIENKNTTTDVNTAKDNAWREITEIFNRVNIRIRDTKQLKCQWKITKLKARKKCSNIKEFREQILRSSDGSKSPSPMPEKLEIIDTKERKFEHIILEESSNQSTPSTPSTSPQIQEIEQPLPSIRQAVFSVKDPTTNPKRHRFAKKKMISGMLNFREASLDDMHKFRTLENDRLQKEHEFRLKSMTEAHSQVMVNLKLQEEILKKMLKNCDGD